MIVLLVREHILDHPLPNKAICEDIDHGVKAAIRLVAIQVYSVLIYCTKIFFHGKYLL